MMNHSDLLTHWHYDPLTGLFKNRTTGRTVGSLTRDGYVRLRPFRGERIYLAHRLAWFYVTGSHPQNGIDHINGIKTDNRLGNLREASDSENLQNLRKARVDNRVDLIGANFHSPSGRWRSQIAINGVKIHLGYFETSMDAHIAYLAAKRKYHPFGEIAKLPSWLLPPSA